jgi:hypothetical protein
MQTKVEQMEKETSDSSEVLSKASDSFNPQKYDTTLAYSPCIHCVRHPWYPDVPAVTLHRGGSCCICGKSSY